MHTAEHKATPTINVELIIASIDRCGPLLYFFSLILEKHQLKFKKLIHYLHIRSD
jgi:hypothetical protein